MSATRSHMAEAVPTAPGRVTEIVGSSDESVDAAIDDGVARAVGPAQSLDWLEITGVRSNVLGGTHRYRVALRIGLRSAA